MRIALVSDTAISGLCDPLARLLAEQDLHPEFTVMEGGTEGIMDPGCALYPSPGEGSPPELTVLVLHARELAPELFRARTLLAPASVREAICARAIAAVLERALAIRRGTGGAVLVADLATPLRSPLGIQDAAVELGLRASVQHINRGIEDGVRGIEGVGMLARAAAAARLGAAHLEPGARWRRGLEESPAVVSAWAREISRHVAALRGRTRSVLVLDLDNTLWGGAGDEILLSPEGRGRAWYDFQQACVDLRDRGVSLAIAAKGSRAAALELLARHPHSLLRPDDFEAIEIGWEDKATSCLRIAGRLGVGLNELVLFDDNPVERRWVSEALPEVEVIPVPADPTCYVDALWDTAAFESSEPAIASSPRLWLVA